jgi:hypothetical protein
MLLQLSGLRTMRYLLAQPPVRLRSLPRTTREPSPPEPHQSAWRANWLIPGFARCQTLL